MITFDAPLLLWVAPLVAAAIWLAAAWARRARLRRAAAWSDEAVGVARAAGRFGAGGLALAAGFAAVALAGPRWGSERVVTEARGLDLVIAIDISKSMLAEDVAPSRLARAVREARRLVHDLEGDRLGLVAFTWASYILAPLSVDASALALHLDALDPGIASQGGTALGTAIAQSVQLLEASPDDGDRVLVMFTDGEAHDSLAQILEEARRVAELSIHLILVAAGGRDPVRIPVRNADGATAWHRDGDGTEIRTARRDDVLRAVADAAQGTIVAADLPDQAGAVRELVASFKRTAASDSRARRGRPRAWIAVLLALTALATQALTRRTSALVGIALALGPGLAAAQAPARPRTPGQKAWDRGDPVGAAAAYLREVAARQEDDTAWYNAGAAALLAGDTDAARTSLQRAAASLDPDVRFRALYNLGALTLDLARRDSAGRAAHAAEAERAYREALLLRPGHLPSKWNLEIATRMARPRGGAPPPTPPPNPQPPRGGPPPPPGAGMTGMTETQADQVLRSIGEQELRTRRDQAARTRRATPPGVKDW